MTRKNFPRDNDESTTETKAGKKMTCGIQSINAIFHEKDEHLNLTSIDKGGKKMRRSFEKIKLKDF